MGLLQRNMKKCGRSVTLIRHADTAAGLSHRGRDKTQDVKTTVQYANFTDYEKFEVDGTIIKATDQKVIIDTSIENNLPDLTKHDELQDGTVLWKIKSVKTYRSKSDTLLYKIQVRR